MCGCGGGGGRVRPSNNVIIGSNGFPQSQRLGNSQPQAGMAAVSPQVTSNVPPRNAAPFSPASAPRVPSLPQETNQDRKRIQKLREQAIREAMNK